MSSEPDTTSTQDPPAALATVHRTTTQVSGASRALLHGAAVASLLAVLGFLIVAAVVFAGPGNTLDHDVATHVVAWRTPMLTALAMSLAWTGNFPPLFVVGLIALLMGIAFSSIRRESLTVTVILLCDLVVSTTLKSIFARPRPDASLALLHLHSYSFPSGHSLVATSLFAFLGFLAISRQRRTGARVLAWTATTLWVLAIGLSRIYLGVHYTSDVIAGFLSGIPILCAAIVTCSPAPSAHDTSSHPTSASPHDTSPHDTFPDRRA